MKLRLKLNPSELTALDTLLSFLVYQAPMNSLKKDPFDYLICATLVELFGRVHGKRVSSLAYAYPATAVIRLSLTPAQAVALYTALKWDWMGQPSLYLNASSGDSYEYGLIVTLVDTIHQQYFA